MRPIKRRSLMTGLAGAALGSTALAVACRAGAQPARKEVRIGGQPVRVVDIHAHCYIPMLAQRVPAADAPSGFPALALGPHRLDSMDERGIDVQVLSINQYWWYAADAALAERIVAVHDEALAEWCAEHSERFVALTSVALQHPALAAEQLERAVAELGHRGASIGGHVNGESPSLPKFDPFWSKAEELGVPVFMHPNNAANLVRDGALDGRGGLDNVVGNPLETTVFLSRMIFDGTLDRFPRLKLCAAHGGGFLPSYLGRSDYACERDGAECANRRKPSEYLTDQVLVDSMVFSSEGLRHLVAETGPSQVVYGSDLPYMWPDTIDLIVDAPFLSDADKTAILGGNLMELLRIDA